MKLEPLISEGHLNKSINYQCSLNRIFDPDGDGQATLTNIVDAIVAIYRERKKLALTLKVWSCRAQEGMVRAKCNRIPKAAP